MAAALPTTERFAIGDEIVIGRLSEELTGAVAAGHLSVSRPTLMTCVHDGEIASFTGGARDSAVARCCECAPPAPRSVAVRSTS